MTNQEEKFIPEFLKTLSPFASFETLYTIYLDDTWSEIVDRMSEFAVMAKPEFSLFLDAVAKMVKYNHEIETKQVPLTKGSPRIFRAHLHKIIETVRLMRASIEEKSISALDDFDDLAADIQRTHDDYATNLYYDSMIL